MLRRLAPHLAGHSLRRFGTCARRARTCAATYLDDSVARRPSRDGRGYSIGRRRTYGAPYLGYIWGPKVAERRSDGLSQRDPIDAHKRLRIRCPVSAPSQDESIDLDADR